MAPAQVAYRPTTIGGHRGRGARLGGDQWSSLRTELVAMRRLGPHPSDTPLLPPGGEARMGR